MEPARRYRGALSVALPVALAIVVVGFLHAPRLGSSDTFDAGFIVFGGATVCYVAGAELDSWAGRWYLAGEAPSLLFVALWR